MNKINDIKILENNINSLQTAIDNLDLDVSLILHETTEDYSKRYLQDNNLIDINDINENTTAIIILQKEHQIMSINKNIPQKILKNLDMILYQIRRLIIYKYDI